MIVELGPAETRESLRAWLLPAALTALLLLVLGVASEPTPRVAEISGLAQPRHAVLTAPRAAARDLTLPVELGQRIGRGAGGVTGMPTEAVLEIQETWWQFRLADGRDARLSRLPRGDSFIAPRSGPVADVTLRGGQAQSFTTSTSAAVTWTESGATYQLSSRTLSVAELVRLADALIPD